MFAQSWHFQRILFKALKEDIDNCSCGCPTGLKYEGKCDHFVLDPPKEASEGVGPWEEIFVFKK